MSQIVIVHVWASALEPSAANDTLLSLCCSHTSFPSHSYACLSPGGSLMQTFPKHTTCRICHCHLSSSLDHLIQQQLDLNILGPDVFGYARVYSCFLLSKPRTLSTVSYAFTTAYYFSCANASSLHSSLSLTFL